MRTDTFELSTPKTTITRIGGAIAVAFLILLGVSAHLRPAAAAETVCRTHGEVTKLLDREFSESPVAIGLTYGGAVIQVFAQGDGQTWTIVSTRPDGVSCFVAGGEAWQALPRKVRGPDA